MFYVYILQSKQRFYVGKTVDLKKRIKEHNSGQNISTKAYRPWKLIFYESYANEGDADRREKYLKTTQGRHALRRMLRCYLEDEGIKYFEY